MSVGPGRFHFGSLPENGHNENEESQNAWRFFLSPLTNVEYHQIEPNSVYVWIFTHSFCSEGDLVGSGGPAETVYRPKDHRNGRTGA